MSPAELDGILRSLPLFESDRLLASWSHGEDAALWTLDDERIGILTVDFITPVADDARRFGEIAAANALSDVFAMGGRPLFALNIVCFPTACQPISLLAEILQGGAAKVMEAGAVLAGGHSVQDEEPKYGLVVYGEVRRGREWKVSGARDGDVLILTKALGTGAAITAIKAGLLPEAAANAALASMAALNDLRGLSIPEHLTEQIHAATDVTGFGLAGHALDMTDDGLSLDIISDNLPLLSGVEEMTAMGLIPEGTYGNRAFYGGRVDNSLSDKVQIRRAEDFIYDPQTSGGLLLALPPEAATELLPLLAARFPRAAVMGRFRAQSGPGRVRVV